MPAAVTLSISFSIVSVSYTHLDVYKRQVLTPVYIMRLVRVKFSDTFVGYKHFELGESQITSATCTGIPES